MVDINSDSRDESALVHDVGTVSAVTTNEPIDMHHSSRPLNSR